MICPPDHRHGETSACYNNHKCKCTDCNANNAKRKSDRVRLIAYGRYVSPRVSAQPIRDHVTMLRESGVGMPQIAKTANISYRAVDSLMYGNTNRKPPAWITRKNAEAILAVSPDDTAMVPARGTARRIQALAVMGWSHAAVGRKLGCSAQNVWQLARSTRVTRATHQAISDLFDLLWDQPPNETANSIAKARSVARRNGWVGPLAWDDIDTDDQPPSVEKTEIEDPIAIQLLELGETVEIRKPDRPAAVVALHRLRWSDAKIARAIAVDPQTVLRIRRRLSLKAHQPHEIEAAA